MSREGLIALIVSVVTTAVLVGFLCWQGQVTQRAYIKAGYTRTTLPGSGYSEWVKP